MSLARVILLVVLGTAALAGGVVACATETELNPQPLPPEDGKDDGRGTGNNGPGYETPGTGGSSGTSPTPPPQASSDGGTDADGGD